MLDSPKKEGGEQEGNYWQTKMEPEAVHLPAFLATVMQAVPAGKKQTEALASAIAVTGTRRVASVGVERKSRDRSADEACWNEFAGPLFAAVLGPATFGD